MDIRVAGFIWSEETEVSFGVPVPSPTLPLPYLELWLVSMFISSHLSSHYPLGDGAIAGEADVWEETLLSRSAHHTVDVHCQCLFLEFTDTEKSTQTSIIAWVMITVKNCTVIINNSNSSLVIGRSSR